MFLLYKYDCKLPRAIVLRIPGCLFVLPVVGRLIARCYTHVLANAIDACRYDEPLFVEANADRSASVHISNGALQQR